ncbi:PTS fructose transporter subunit IIA [Paucibacter sp. APW11]|uniref:PTS fructose transporter subunit IIA n=1 Tax=Roseateles aquae TaxID=3077235 RepID=A0ABU3PB74_9BURK|nr:PTS fructose transporter subunit IIA [Paucibacter sp. APW11]MDT8999794.1 PTS fructose transporter subunit IIA [Paucibacter sp. APW11]
MPGLLVIAHAPLATALKAVAEHTFPNCAPQLSVLDVTPEMSADAVEQAARLLLAQGGHQDWLVLTDVFGATPSNAAQRLLDAAGHVRTLSGVNVPMLWRSLCYAQEPLAALVLRASQGGSQGMVLNDPVDSQIPPPL